MMKLSNVIPFYNEAQRFRRKVRSNTGLGVIVGFRSSTQPTVSLLALRGEQANASSHAKACYCWVTWAQPNLPVSLLALMSPNSSM